VGDPFEFGWREGVLTDVTQLTGRRFERVVGINRRGEIVGYGPGGVSLETLFWDGRTTVVLGGLRGTGTADLNDHGDVVGNAVIGFYDFQSVAVLWPRATRGR
jgi:hypothetical protein